MKLLKFVLAILSVGLLFFISGSKANEPLGEEFTPASIVSALGDSITQAANVCEAWQECPQVSWATGMQEPENDPFNQKETNGIYSVAYNIAYMPNGVGKDIVTYNNARSNTTTSSLEDQARLAVSQNAEFVTILSGANDVCASNETNIIPNDQFRTNISKALNVLHKGLPKAKIFFVSIPDLYNLWDVSHNNSEAVQKWSEASLCQSMLGNPTSVTTEDMERRDRVRERTIEFNKIIETECQKMTGCFFDDNRLFETKFSQSELSTVDYFHPNLLGQRKIVERVWTLETPVHALVSRGVIKRSSPDAPFVTIKSPKDKETVFGKEYKAVVKVESKSKITRVYADTQLGSVDLSYDNANDYWYLILDTTLAPDNITTFFTVVAMDENDETTVTDKVTVTVKNNFENWEDYVDSPNMVTQQEKPAN